MKTKTKLPAKIRKAVKKARQPVWSGPESDGPQGGITQSLLSRFLVCKERFRIHAIEGWQAAERFNAPLHYGNMWHVCEEAHAAPEHEAVRYDEQLRIYCQELCKQFPTQQAEVEKYYHVCLKQFPIYVEYWAKHPDVKQRTPLLQEQSFKVPYELPSGRVVFLRGKWDSVDLIGKGKQAGIYLQENKSKGRIEEEYLRRQLTFDLQTMLYLIALEAVADEWGDPIKGIRFNVIRRPLSGGKGSIRQHKPTKSNPQGESSEGFYDRLQQYFIDEPEYWFMRWKVEISAADIQRFKDEFLDPCLEHLCLWYNNQANIPLNSKLRPWINELGWLDCLHYRLPYGVFNPLLEGKGTDLEEYLLSGSTVGLKRVTSLFGELE